METRYPIRKADGKDFAGPDEILALLRNERHGQWLAGNNGMWHGGIHISRESAPLAVISAESAEGAVPLQCIAQGEIVAWRLQQDYHQQPYGEAAEGEEAINLKYSSAFVLVRSVHKPDENPATWLTFYTLYMHLAPLSCFPKMVVYEVTPEGQDLRKRLYSGTEESGQIAPDPCGKLSAGDRLTFFDEITFLLQRKGRDNSGRALPDKPAQFGLVQLLKDGVPTGDKFWTSSLPEHIAPQGEKYAYLPDWMDKAVQNGTMDAVVVPPQPIAIRAGDAIGFLAQDDAPVTGGAVQSDWFMHIEVLSNDANMPAFLSNPGHLTKGTLYIEVQGGQPLYRCEEKDGKKIFTPPENTSDAEAGKLLRRDDAKPFKDEAGISWYLIKPETWIKQDGIKEIIQHDLKALRFTPLEQEPAKDFQQSLGEPWLSKAFNFISGAVHPERALESQELSEYYSQIAKVLDANGDGKISATELKLYRTAVLQGLRHNNEEVEMLLRRLIVKHESEWYGKSSHPRWQTLLGSLPKAGQDYAKIWIDNHEWMSQVPALAKDEAVWHFHPVEFVHTLYFKSELIDVDSFMSQYEKEHISFAPKTTALSQVSKINLRRILANINEFYPKHKEYKPNLYWVSYMLATARHETYHYPSMEYFSEKPEVGDLKYFNKYDPILAATPFYRKRAIDNGNTKQGDGYKYRGRGCVHLTWKNNYQKAKEKFGSDYVMQPELAANFDHAVPIMIWGMYGGVFTGGKLSSYINSKEIDYVRARGIINGSDQAVLIASYADRFQSILERTSNIPKDF
ncbi:hypothetical protein [Siccibacter colletis]|uniref:hypothetical protein n=1 Tax=Siccibacter colletis TaxID=1505757 RepID=UPI00068E871A|nr:hypothetical protein [Siccibacter colletis]